MCKCNVCDKSFQFGHHRYDGRKIAAYKIMVCRNCYDNNRDGWAPQYEEKVTSKLNQREKAQIQRNELGLLPLE